MPRVNLLDFNGDKHKGLWISGPRERTPQSHLRRLTGVHQIRERELRTRNGSTTDAVVAAAHSLTRFNDVRFQGATTILFRAAVSISTGFDGTPLEFEVSNPRTGTSSEFLFVAGGGKLEKVDTTGAISNWGIDPPSTGDWGAAIGDVGTGESDSLTTVFDPQEKSIAITTSTLGWAAVTGSNVTPVPTIDTDNVPTASGSGVCFVSVEIPEEQDQSAEAE